MIYNIFGFYFQNSQPSGIAGFDFSVFFQGDYAAGHTLQHTLVSVLHILDIIEEFCIFQSNGNLCGKGFKTRLIIFCKGTSAFVQQLDHADLFADLVDYWNTENGFGKIAGFFIESRIEAEIRVSMRNVDGISAAEYGSGNSEMTRETDFLLGSRGYFRKQFICLFVNQKQGGTVRIKHSSGFVHNLVQNLTEVYFRRDVCDNSQKLFFTLAGFPHFLDDLTGFQGNRGLGGHGIKEFKIIFCKFPLSFVENLRDADNFALDRFNRIAKDTFGFVAGFFVNTFVKTGIIVGVIDDSVFAFGEYETDNPFFCTYSDFMEKITPCHAGV